MAGLIPQSFVNSLVERVDIADVIGPRVQLRKAGTNQMGLCPFHDEKTPSFHVYPDGHYHCFGCGAHGTTLGFLMDMDGLSFPEAVESLASIAGVEIPREAGRERQTDPALYDVLDAANDRFKGWLRDHAEAGAAVDYLKHRGVTGKVARDFGIGLAPSGWQGLKSALDSHGEQRLIDAGLLVKADSGRTYDRFRERIVFPIRDIRGRVIGFGGRVFGANADGQPKYLNSPETDVFRKGRELYGLFEARRARRRLDSIVVVEGYMDVVALAQHGVSNAVATLGTAIGEAHFDKLYRYVDVVVCCFDGDDAGRGAAWKAVDAAFPALSAGRQLRFVFLGEGQDPDTVVRQHGADHFNELLARAAPAGEYFLDHLQAGLDLSQLDGRAMLGELALPHLRKLSDGVLRATLVRDLAVLTENDPAVLERQLRDASVEGDAWEHRHGTIPAPTAPAEQSKLATPLLHLLVRNPQFEAGMAAAERSRLLEVAEGALGDVARFLAETSDADTATLLGRFVGEPAYGQLAMLAAKPTLLDGAALENEFSERVRHYLAKRNPVPRALFEDAVTLATPEAMRRHSDAKRERGPEREQSAPGVDPSPVAPT